jgi:hypothetical protein
MGSDEQQIQAYAGMIDDRVAAGWKPFLLTFMFEQIVGSPCCRTEVMRKEVERVYATVLTRIVRHPRSEWHAWKNPIWIGGPDFPVPKHERQDKRDVIPNDGQHVHAVALMPPVSRLRQPLDDHFDDEQTRYVRDPLFRIHTRRITHNPRYVGDYVLKSFKRARADVDDLIILPRALTELTRPGAIKRPG